MKSFMQRVDRFCVRHPNFGIPRLMLYVVIGNALVFVFSLMDTTHLLLSYLAFSPALILRGQVWRLLTFALIPNSSGLWTLIFLYFYYYLGNTLERVWGSAKFNVYFFSGVLFTVLYGFVVYFLTGIDLRVNAHYIYLSMFLAFAANFPEQQVLLMFFIPVKMKWLAWLDGALILLGVLTDPFPLNLLPLVALLNFLLFCGGDVFLPVRRRSRAERQTFRNFHREMEQANAKRRAAPYRFRCEICGRTDLTDPTLEFRYCSRCQGYHCFCAEHINHHTHFTE